MAASKLLILRGRARVGAMSYNWRSCIARVYKKE